MAELNGRTRRGRPRRSNGEATRKRLVAEATQLFAERGYEATSLRQIANAARVDLATLKYHFGDKPKLYSKVYNVGHAAFFDGIEPIFAQMITVESRSDMEKSIFDLVAFIHDFVESHLAFVRMVLFRLLENTKELQGLEDELQAVAIGFFEETFQKLRARKIIRDVDIRALISLFISAFGMWFVTDKVRPSWAGFPNLKDKGGRKRSEAFLTDLLCKALLF